MKKKLFIFIGIVVFFSFFFLILSGFEIFNALKKENNIIPINTLSLEILENMALKQPFNVAILGDSKKGTKVLERLIKKAKNTGCKVVFHLGDVMPYNNENYYRYFYSEFKEMLKEYKIPIFLIPGNHDTRDKSENYNKNLFEKYFGKCNEIIRINNVEFVLIDDSSGNLNKNNIKNLRKMLDGNNKKLNFLLFHIPTRDPRPKKNHCLHNTVSKKLLEQFIGNYKFNAVFSAHIHSHGFYKIGNIPVYITGEAGASLIVGRDYSFLKLSIENNEFKVKRIVMPWEIGLHFIDYFETKVIKFLN